MTDKVRMLDELDERNAVYLDRVLVHDEAMHAFEAARLAHERDLVASLDDATERLETMEEMCGRLGIPCRVQDIVAAGPARRKVPL